MAQPSSQTPVLRREEVLAKGSACTRLLESCGQVAVEHPRCWERIWAAALRQRMESELHLASKEQMAVRRAALHRLLQDEHQQHQWELHRLGKAFYVERLWAPDLAGSALAHRHPALNKTH